MKTSWENSGLSQDQQSDIGLQLREMEKDGLVKLTDDGTQSLKPVGRLSGMSAWRLTFG